MHQEPLNAESGLDARRGVPMGLEPAPDRADT